MNLIDELILVPIIDDNIKMYLTEIDSITVFICQNPKLKEKLVTTEIKLKKYHLGDCCKRIINNHRNVSESSNMDDC